MLAIDQIRSSNGAIRPRRGKAAFSIGAILLLVGSPYAAAVDGSVEPQVPITETYFRNVRLNPEQSGGVLESLQGLSSPVAAHDESKRVGGYGVQPGDVLHISVWREKDLQLEVLVGPDGRISMPLAGDVPAGGKTIPQLQDAIGRRLMRYIPDPSVSVAVKEVKGNVVFVTGSVERPGEFVIGDIVNVMQALSMAGGMTRFAKANKIRILRRENGKQLAIPFRYGEVEQGENLEQNILLQSGDIVMVP